MTWNQKFDHLLALPEFKLFPQKIGSKMISSIYKDFGVQQSNVKSLKVLKHKKEILKPIKESTRKKTEFDNI